MRYLFKKLMLFIIPFVLILAGIIYIDFFKVFYKRDFYNNTFIQLNREWVTTQMYTMNRAEQKYNAFVFGSSRSQAFKTKEWKKYIHESAIPFHYDASAESIYGIANKVRYIDSLGDTIKYALMIIDPVLLTSTSNKEGHLFTSPPCLSGESSVAFYSSFITASLDPYFIFSYLDFSINGTYKSYMKPYIVLNKNMEIRDSIYADVYYSKEVLIKKDSIGYYNAQFHSGGLYYRSKIMNDASKVSAKEKMYLKQIKQIFDNHNTDYKVVISPLYNQVFINKYHLLLLNSIFGKDKVYNFSGINDYTIPVGNYYESAHYRPSVANKILKEIYSK